MTLFLFCLLASPSYALDLAKIPVISVDENEQEIVSEILPSHYSIQLQNISEEVMAQGFFNEFEKENDKNKAHGHFKLVRVRLALGTSVKVGIGLFSIEAGIRQSFLWSKI